MSFREKPACVRMLTTDISDSGLKSITKLKSIFIFFMLLKLAINKIYCFIESKKIFLKLSLVGA